MLRVIILLCSSVLSYNENYQYYHTSDFIMILLEKKTPISCSGIVKQLVQNQRVNRIREALQSFASLQAV